MSSTTQPLKGTGFSGGGDINSECLSESHSGPTRSAAGWSRGHAVMISSFLTIVGTMSPK